MLGVTKSLRKGSTNFILHFGQRADEEFFCEKRDQLISVLAAQHEQVEQRPLQVFGLASATLEDYLTTERDLANRITRMPPPEFLLNKRETFIDENDADKNNGD